MRIKDKTPLGGYTLVEIMIVVAIIGLLAAMAIPHLGDSRRRAYQTACISNLRQIDGAIQRWALDQRKDAGEPVTYSDIGGYLRGSVSCPAGGTSFADSYTITVVDAPPLCARQPASHRFEP